MRKRSTAVQLFLTKSDIRQSDVRLWVGSAGKRRIEALCMPRLSHAIMNAPLTAGLPWASAMGASQEIPLQVLTFVPR